jgi:O-methyltransferase involved in polyketide biosynthesis
MKELKKLEKGSVQETMIGPLWARAIFSDRYPEILDDPKAIEIYKQLDYDFSDVEEFLEEFRGLGLLIRARSFDDALKKYLEKFPNATVVNIGSGLDTTFSRVDNGKIKWYNLDLPDAIEFRKQFLSDSPRSECIIKSALDISWFDDVEFQPENGIFLIMGGLIYYFSEKEVASLFHALANRFPGGEIIFDAISKIAIKKGKQMAKKRGVEPLWKFSMGKPQKVVPKWANKLEIIDSFPVYSRTPKNPNWKKKTRRMISLMNIIKPSRINQLRFIE